MIYVLEIRERAVGKGRPRFNTKTYTTYTPEKTKAFEERLKMYFIKKYRRPEVSENPFKTKILAEFKPPKSLSKKKQMQLIGKPYPKKPDMDNIIKAILDSLNELAYKDDNQIVSMNAEKKYGLVDRIIIILEEIIEE